jgi:hypothetical protein
VPVVPRAPECLFGLGAILRGNSAMMLILFTGFTLSLLNL